MDDIVGGIKVNVYKPGEFARIVGVTTLTLRNWDKKGILKAHKTPSNRSFYTDEHLAEFKRGKKEQKHEK